MDPEDINMINIIDFMYNKACVYFSACGHVAISHLATPRDICTYMYICMYAHNLL